MHTFAAHPETRSWFAMLTGTRVADAVAAALRWLQDRQLPDGSIVDDPGTLVFQEWDTVNALKAIGTWRHDVPYSDGGTVDAALGFLQRKRKPGGMLSWGVLDTTPDEYCTETSSEYVSAL